MSTTTYSYSAVSEEVTLRQLREKEEQARKALRRRLGAAQKNVAAQEKRYEKLLAKFDGTRAQLPDLTYTLPSLPSAPAGNDPAAFERHAKTLADLIKRYEQEGQKAINDAEIALERRRQLAATWTEIHAVEAEIVVRNQVCATLAQGFGTRFVATSPKALHKTATLEQAQAHLQNIRATLADLQTHHKTLQQLAETHQGIRDAEAKIEPYRADCLVLAQHLNEQVNIRMLQPLNKSASLVDAQAYLQTIQTYLSELQAQHSSLSSRVQSRERAQALSGNVVAAVSASARQAAWETEKNREAREKTKRNIEAALIAAKLDMAELPQALQLQAATVLETPEADAGKQVADQINRHRVRLDKIATAEQMLAEPPQYADDSTGAMNTRWTNLVKRLEAVICGWDEFSASLELEHRQIQEDCARAMQRAYGKAHFFEVAADSELSLSDGEDGLVLMDLDGFPGYYVKSENIQVDDGYVTEMQLLADPDVVGNASLDQAATKVACDRLQAMANRPGSSVATEVREKERKPEVTRKRRPVSRKAHAAHI